MAFPATYTPTAWVAGVTPLSQGNMNNLETQFDQVEANFQFVPKTADETVNNSNVLQNDDDLLFAIGTAGTWAFNIVLFAHGAAAADIKFAITIPGGGATLCWGMGSMGYYNNAATWIQSTAITASGTALNCMTVAAGEGSALIYVISGWVKSGGTGGNVQLQWAQFAADVSNTIVMEESYLVAHRLA